MDGIESRIRADTEGIENDGWSVGINTTAHLVGEKVETEMNGTEGSREREEVPPSRMADSADETPLRAASRQNLVTSRKFIPQRIVTHFKSAFWVKGETTRTRSTRRKAPRIESSRNARVRPTVSVLRVLGLLVENCSRCGANARKSND